MLAQELMTFGLSNKEADVYVEALKAGYASVQEIADKTNINRTTVYSHIKNLISRGLMSAVEKNGHTFFVAAHPDKLQHIHEQYEREMHRKRDILNSIMPELESIYHLAKDRPMIKYYNDQNPETLAAKRSEICQNRSEEMYNIFNYERFKDDISPKHIKNLLDNVGCLKAIYIANRPIVDPRLHDFMDNEKLQLRYLPIDKFAFLCEILIADDRVYIARDTDSILIKDKLFAQTLGLLFHALWGLGEKI